MYICDPGVCQRGYSHERRKIFALPWPERAGDLGDSNAGFLLRSLTQNFAHGLLLADKDETMDNEIASKCELRSILRCEDFIHLFLD